MEPTTPPGGPPTAPRTVDLVLLGPFQLVVDGVRVELPPPGRRVLALLALSGGDAHRIRLAGTLWPDQGEERALANLRSAVWRLPDAARPVLDRRGTTLTLVPEVRVDLDAAQRLTARLLDGAPGRPSPAERDLLTRDLLPHEDEPWLGVAREQHRQRRLHALERLAEDELLHGRPLDAVDTALLAVATDPLRESAHLLLVRAHLAAGNRASAVRHVAWVSTLLAQELGVRPSPQLEALLGGMPHLPRVRRVDPTTTLRPEDDARLLHEGR